MYDACKESCRCCKCALIDTDDCDPCNNCTPVEEDDNMERLVYGIPQTATCYKYVYKGV